MEKENHPVSQHESPFPEPIEIPIEDSIDLHLFAPHEIKAVVEEYITQAAARGFREARVIHGKGIGECRRQTQEILKRHPKVERYFDAPSSRGGWGATIVFLKKNEDGCENPET